MRDENGTLKCDMKRECTEAVTHIDEKGFVYCRAHGISRKSWMRCRQLTPRELKQLKSGEPLPSYDVNAECGGCGKLSPKRQMALDNKCPKCIEAWVKSR
jgi:hypothetical protein